MTPNLFIKINQYKSTYCLPPDLFMDLSVTYINIVRGRKNPKPRQLVPSTLLVLNKCTRRTNQDKHHFLRFLILNFAHLLLSRVTKHHHVVHLAISHTVGVQVISRPGLALMVSLANIGIEIYASWLLILCL
jgi:hypothetical protein